MFNGCTSLVTAPTLPATTLATYCYQDMLRGCISLTMAPVLPATTLVSGCYQGMFNSCTSLTKAPALPAETLANNCYYYMFYNCTSLTQAPELPATELIYNCYQSMFNGCTSLTQAPELPATTLAQSCYSNMFYGCTSLNYVKCLATTNIITSNCNNWLSGVATEGTFVKASGTTWPNGSSGIPDGWGEEKPFIPTTQFTSDNYLTVTITPSGSNETYFWLNSKSTNQTMYLSENNNDWMEMAAKEKYPISATTLYVCGKLTGDNGSSNYTQFAMRGGSFSISGNCNSLWDYENIDAPLKQYCGFNLFSGCTLLTTAPDLPAITLSDSCYRTMFYDCALTQAPVLPATTLANNCYRSMFWNCTSLTSAPELSATTLLQYCYRSMFYGCSSLTEAPELPATTLATKCYEMLFQNCSKLNYVKCLATTNITTNNCTNWLNGVASEGTFEKASDTTWPSGSSGIPTGWTIEEV